jgi:hypothetical protein
MSFLRTFWVHSLIPNSLCSLLRGILLLHSSWDILCFLGFNLCFHWPLQTKQSWVRVCEETLENPSACGRTLRATFAAASVGGFQAASVSQWLVVALVMIHTQQSLRPEKNFSDSLTERLLEPCAISCMIPASAALKFSARESLRSSHRSHKFSILILFESPGSWWRLQILWQKQKPRQNPNLQNVRNRQSKILTHAFVKRQLWVEIPRGSWEILQKCENVPFSWKTSPAFEKK